VDTPNVQPSPVNPPPLTLAYFGLYQTKCTGSTCRAEIGFAPTAASKARMPLNWVADPAGNVRLEDGYAVVVQQAELMPPTPDIRWMPHHATCPNADEWRQPK